MVGGLLRRWTGWLVDAGTRAGLLRRLARPRLARPHAYPLGARELRTCRSAPTTHCSTRSRASASPRATGRRTSRPTWRACPDGPPMSAGAPIRTGTPLVDLLALRVVYERALLEPGVEYDATRRPGIPPSHRAPSSTDRAARVCEALGCPSGHLRRGGRSRPRARRAPGRAPRPGLAGGLRGPLSRRASAVRRDRAALPAAPTRGPPRSSCVASTFARRVCDATSSSSASTTPSAFAGFFAVAIRYHDLAGGRPSALCPVLLSPRNEVHELPAPGEDASARRQIAGRRMLAGAQDSFRSRREGRRDEPLRARRRRPDGPALPSPQRRRLRPDRTGPHGIGRARRATPNAPTVIAPHESFAADSDERALVADASLTMMGRPGTSPGLSSSVVTAAQPRTTRTNRPSTAVPAAATAGRPTPARPPPS